MREGDGYLRWRSAIQHPVWCNERTWYLMLARMTFGGTPVADVPGPMNNTETILSSGIARRLIMLRDRGTYVGQV
jgi:hypothetical protein